MIISLPKSEQPGGSTAKTPRTPREKRRREKREKFYIKI
jgi:hypothetical protein